MQDCLACSGCVTSAETILLEHQSAEEFVSKLAQPDTTVLVSVSPQSRAALAAYYGLSSAETMSRYRQAANTCMLSPRQMWVNSSVSVLGLSLTSRMKHSGNSACLGPITTWMGSF